jgi:deoxycytidylate deaminase
MAANIELIVGLVGPIGTDLGRVSQILRHFFDKVGFESSTYRLSDELPLSASKRRSLSGFDRYSALMDMGDKLRERSKRKDAVAGIAVAQVQAFRSELTRKFKRQRIEHDVPLAVVLKQFKTPEEIDSLRKFYGNRLIVVSCHSRRTKRVDALSRKLADASSASHAGAYRSEAERLISRDEEDQRTKWGQNVRKAFPKADLFVDVDDIESLQSSLNRQLEILFQHPHHTPTRDEYCMFLAEAAALRSAALGRQVGAVITTRNGDVIAVGCNEVPKWGGGLYWEGDIPDRRDSVMGFDSNDRFKENLLKELIARLKEAKWLNSSLQNMGMDEIVDSLLYADNSAILEGTQVDSIIEFGRCVHAEMAAIVDAARRGASVDECVLYTSTFPCHECARHIVASGIRRVVYRLPYPKSLVRELFPDSIDIDGAVGNTTKVLFEPFVGVAPRRYSQFFTMRVRKNSRGDASTWVARQAKPNLGDYFPDHQQMKRDEDVFLSELDV